MKKDIGNQLPFLKQRCGSEYVERVAPNVLEEFNNSMLRKIAGLIKQMEVQRILTL